MTILLGTGIGLTRSGRRGGGGPGPSFTPASLFAAGEKGAWYDPSDLSSLFVDIAMTTNVSADQDPVSVMLDKSGNGNHLFQTNGSARPVWRSGTIASLQFVSNRWMAGNDAHGIAYDPRTEPLYVGSVALCTDASVAYPLAFGKDSAFRLFHTISSSVANGYLAWDGDNCSYTKAASLSLPAYLDTQAKAVPTGAFASTDMDLQVDGAAGALVQNQGPVVYQGPPCIAGIGTAGFTAAAGDPQRFYGGIIVLRSLAQSERNSLRTYFSSLR